MNKNSFVLISKDAMCTDYLPVYGNKYFKTPNIDELAEMGTVYKNHFTAAPSTVMSFYSMVTGIYPYETEYELFERKRDVFKGKTMFSRLTEKGYKCHIVWGDIWMDLLNYVDYFRNDVTIHMVDKFRQGVGAHYKHNGFLIPDDEKRKATYESVINIIKEILCNDDKIFLWIHFPHVIHGEVAYGSDIELFDKYVGVIRTLVLDNHIAITADHGNMNGHKGKICYGFDVYQPAIRIPLITPRKGKLKECNFNTTSCDLYTLLFEEDLPKRKYIYIDTAFKAQRHRKLAIVYDKYKYIYNKETKKEELYDLQYDPYEEFSIMEDYIYDKDRHCYVPSREVYYYPEWDNLDEVRTILRNEKNRIWKNGSKRAYIKGLWNGVKVRIKSKLKIRK